MPLSQTFIQSLTTAQLSGFSSTQLAGFSSTEKILPNFPRRSCVAASGTRFNKTVYFPI